MPDELIFKQIRSLVSQHKIRKMAEIGIYTIPTISLMTNYMNQGGMDFDEFLEYEVKYHKFKRLEKIRLNGFTLRDEDLDEYESLGSQLEKLCKKIIKNK